MLERTWCAVAGYHRIGSWHLGMPALAPGYHDIRVRSAAMW